MKTSIFEVFEQMFFLPVDFVAPDAAAPDPETGGEWIIARLGFSGPPSGVFELRVPRALARSVSADFLGTAPPSLSDDEVTGTVLEMVNMLAGSALSLYDSRELFDLQIPELIRNRDGRPVSGEAAGGITIPVQAPDNRMIFQLILR